MKRLIGSILVGSILCAEPSIELSILNNQNIPLTSVAMSTPFFVAVTIKNGDDIRGWPVVGGLHRLQTVGQRSESKRVVNNGVTSQERTFVYSVVAEAPGEITLGPATVPGIDGVQSNTHSITVLDEKYTKKQRYEKPRFQFIVGRKKAVVGEKIPITLRFMYQNPNLSSISMEKPHDAGFHITLHEQGTARTMVEQGDLFSVIEYTGFLFPDKAGMVTIDKLRAEYADQSRGLGWSPFFGLDMQSKQTVVADPVVLEIDDLPPGITQVGTFSRLQISSVTKAVPQGEAALITLSLEGDADWDSMKSPALTLPAELRSYESKAMQLNDGKGKKWEYVVQGLKEGTFTIPQQRFTFYDTKTRSVKSLTSQPLSLTITPGKIKEPEPQPIVEEPIAATGATEAKPAKKFPILPWPLFLLLLTVPVVLFLILRLPQSIFAHLRLWGKLIIIRNTIRRACASGDLTHMYAYMQEARSYYEQLYTQAWSPSLERDWESFMERLNHYGLYAPEKKVATSAQVKDICTDISLWLTKMRKGGK